MSLLLKEVSKMLGDVDLTVDQASSKIFQLMSNNGYGNIAEDMINANMTDFSVLVKILFILKNEQLDSDLLSSLSEFSGTTYVLNTVRSKRDYAMLENIATDFMERVEEHDISYLIRRDVLNFYNNRRAVKRRRKRIEIRIDGFKSKNGVITCRAKFPHLKKSDIKLFDHLDYTPTYYPNGNKFLAIEKLNFIDIPKLYIKEIFNK